MPTEINVKFRCSQRGFGEDVYYSPERKKCYIRQTTNITDPPAVFWLTCTKWRGGYEASCPIREGITIKAIGPDGEYFEEKIENMLPYSQDTKADKVGKFSWELD